MDPMLPTTENGAIPFRDRADAGAWLARHLQGHVGEGAVLLAMPEGGEVVARAVADRTGLPLFTAPSGHVGGRLLLHGAMSRFRERTHADSMFTPGHSANTDSAEHRLDESLEHDGTAGLPRLQGRVVVVIDDGLSSDRDLQATVEHVVGERPKRIVLAAPVLPRDTVERLSSEVHDMVVLFQPAEFGLATQWYTEID